MREFLESVLPWFQGATARGLDLGHAWLYPMTRLTVCIRAKALAHGSLATAQEPDLAPIIAIVSRGVPKGISSRLVSDHFSKIATRQALR
jgi:hypothetical protein